MQLFSINAINVFSPLYDFLNIIFFSLVYFKNTEYNIQNMCQSTVYAIGKASGQQLEPYIQDDERSKNSSVIIIFERATPICPEI